VLMEPEIEIVSDAPIGRSRRKVAKKATEAGADKCAVTSFGAVPGSTEPAVVMASAGKPVVGRLPDEEIRELVVERLPLNPRLVLASYTVDGRKEIVRFL